MKYLSVCSGIEAATVAWHPLSWTPIGFSEIEKFPSAVLAHHYPDTPNFGDMTKHEQWNIEPGTVDLLVGGTPCQSFSVAGLRQGLKDPRGNLMLTFLAIAARLRPRWIVWENVPGVLSSNGGRDFGSFLGGLGELGYGFAYRVLDAQWMRTQRYPHAVPQRRRRVFVVGCFGDQRSAAAVLFERESVFRNPSSRRSSRRAAGQTVAGTIAARSGESRNNPEGLVWPAQVCSTLNASFADKQGLEDQHALNGAPCFVFGALCAYDQQRQGQYGDGEVASTKLARDFKVATDLIVIDRAAFNQGANAMYTPHIGQTNVMDPLVARGPHAVAIQGTVIGRQDHNGPNSSGCSDGGEMFTLTSTDVHAVAVVGQVDWRTANNDQGQVSQTLKTDLAHQSGPCLAVAPTMQVRRLTPTECERLQGFPDGWTAIPWKKKSAEDCPDGPRYKALGNSMAVNCMAWIGERISEVEAKR